MYLRKDDEHFSSVSDWLALVYFYTAVWFLKPIKFPYALCGDNFFFFFLAGFFCLFEVYFIALGFVLLFWDFLTG